MGKRGGGAVSQKGITLDKRRLARDAGYSATYCRKYAGSPDASTIISSSSVAASVPCSVRAIGRFVEIHS